MESERHPARPPYEVLPRWLRGEVERVLGAPVVAAESAPEGVSPGIAVTVTTARGSRAFLKAASAFQHVRNSRLHRLEAENIARIDGLPAPPLRWSYEDDEWVVLVFDHCDGRNPGQPWQRDELARVIARADEFAAVRSRSELPAMARICFGYGWQALAAGPLPEFGRFAAVRNRLPELLDLEDRFRELLVGDTLQHGDLRAGNVLISDDDVWFVDWSFAGLGPPWLDALMMVPSIAATGGPAPAEVVGMSQSASELSREDLRAIAGGLAGFFIPRAMCPSDPKLPGMRAFQGDQGLAAIKWLDSLSSGPLRLVS